MSEIGVRYVSIMPRIASGFASEINAAVGKGAAGAGKAAGKQLGDDLGKGVEQSASKVGTAFKSVVTGALVLQGARMISGFVRSAVDDFSDLEDATGAAGVVFGDSMDKIIAKGDTAAAKLGMSKAQIIDAANTFGTLGKSANLSGDDLADFSNEMTDVAGSLSSFKGGSPEEAILAVGAALRGESEPIRRYGILLDDATLRQRALTLGIVDNIKTALTPQQRVLAAQAEILAQSGDAMGDFERTANSTANVQKTLAAESANLSAEIGEKLAPMIVSAQKAGIGFLRWVSDNEAAIVPLVSTVGTLTLAIGGFVAVSKGIEAVKAAKATISGLGDAFQQMSTKARIATASAGAVGIALTAGALIYGHFAQKNADAEAAVVDFTKALEADTGALGENTRAAIENQLQSNGMLAAAMKMGISSEALTDAVMGSSDAIEYVNDKMAEYQSQNAALSNRNTGLVSEVSQIKDGMGAMADQIGQAQSAYADYQREAGGAKKATEGNTAATKDNADAQKSLADALWNAQEAQMAARGDHLALEASYDNARGAAKEYREELVKKYKGQGKSAEAAEKAAAADIKAGKAVDSNTEAGRKNREELYRIVDAARAQRESMEKAGDSAADVNSEMERAETQFRKVAKQMGLTKDETEELVTELRQVKSKTVSVTVDLKKTGVSSIQAIPGKGHQLFTMKAYAGGGAITGGYRGRDSVPALLMPDEHVLTTEDVKNLGGHQGVLRMRSLAGQGLLRFASGGPVMPTYKGHSLDWWDDYLLTDLESTRLRIRIKDLKADLKERETYYTGKGKKRKKRSRQKLRGLERTEATLELEDATEQLRLAKEAAKANASASGTIADRVAKYESQLEISENAAAMWRSAAESLTKSGGISLDAIYTSHTNALGERWQTSRDAGAVDFAAAVNSQADQVETFIDLLDQLRRAGASEALVSDVMSLGAVKGSEAARKYLADRRSMASAEQGYARLAAGQARLSAIGDQVGLAAVQVTINEAATPEATKQAVVAGILAGRS